VAEEIQRRWPEEATAWYFVGLARRTFDEEAALEAFARASELDPEIEAPVQHRAEIALGRGETEQALGELASLAERDPRGAAHQANLATALLAEGRSEEAAQAARRALDLAPDLVQAWHTLGTALYSQSRFADARDAFQRAIELEPTGARHYNDLGLALERLGENELAAASLEEALRLDPSSALAHYNRAFLHREQGQSALALEGLARAFECDRDRHDRDLPRELALQDLGDACEAALDGGRGEEAVDALQRVVAADPRAARAHEVLVGVLIRLERSREALAAARRWSELFPEDAKAWNQRAWLQVDPRGDATLRDPLDALRAAEEAVRLSRGEEPGHLDTLAWALHWNGEDERAVEQAERALELAFEQGSSEKTVLELERSLEFFEDARATRR
jgi:tetratricopeptide (TPR) repeat protein